MKINNIILYTVLLSGVLLSSSCRKYVEIDQYGNRTLKYTEDYQYLLNNKNNFEGSYILPLVTSDNIAPEIAETVASTWGENYLFAYQWKDNFYSDNQQDIGWNNLYKQIHVANEILASVMDSQRGSESQKMSIAAEARVHRAFAYFSLANQYAPIYDPAKASSQPGVPMLLTPSLFEKLNRVPLSKVYEQIIDDLKIAIENLTDFPTFNYHPSKISAYALLSRVYLTMRNFDESGRYADLAIALKPTVYNLENFSAATYPRLFDDKEVLLSKISSGFIRGPINPELIALYDQNDLRLKQFIGKENSTYKGYVYLKPLSNNGNYNSYVGLNSPELYLNRAEVYARQNNVAKAVEMLNLLRKKRFSAAHYIALTEADIKADPLQYVIDERRREFVGTDLRWYDMRRLTLDGNYFKTVTRSLNGQTYTLDANSPRLVYPINLNVLSFNPEIGQNPR